MPKAQAKINRSTRLVAIKNFSLQRTPRGRYKDNPQNQKLFANPVSGKGRVSIIHKEHLQLNNKKIKTQLKNRRRIWIDVSQKTVHKWPRSSWYRQPSGNGKQSHSEIPPLPARTEHLYSGRQVSLSAGEDVGSGKAHTPLWGMRAWAAAAENSLAALPTVKHRVPTWPSNHTPWCPPRRHGDAGPHKHPHTDVHGGAIRDGQKKARMSMNWRTENKACASVPWAMIPPWKDALHTLPHRRTLETSC